MKSEVKIGTVLSFNDGFEVKIGQVCDTFSGRFSSGFVVSIRGELRKVDADSIREPGTLGIGINIATEAEVASEARFRQAI